MSDQELLLILETTGFRGSVAIFRGEQCLRKSILSENQRTAEHLIPEIQKAFTAENLKISQIKAIGIANGPGSFTGLRIGVTVAKTLAYAIPDCKLLAVNTLYAIARGIQCEPGPIVVVMDAQRKQLFYSCFEKSDDGSIKSVAQSDSEPKTRIVKRDQLADLIPEKAFVAGPATPQVKTLIKDERPDLIFTNESEIKIEQIGIAVHEKLLSKEFDDMWALKPEYFRKSAAEEKLESK